MSPRPGGGWGAALLDRAAAEANRKGYPKLYLCTHLDGYYEKYGWTRIGTGYELSGKATKVSEKNTRAGYGQI